MRFVAHSDKQPVALMFRVFTKTPRQIRIRVSDRLKPDTIYQDRWKTVNGEAIFFVRMPQSPKHALVEIGNVNGRGDEGFKLVESKMEPLKAKFKKEDIPNKTIRSFVNFAQAFSENAGILSAEDGGKNYSVYMSDDRNFRINYFDTLRTRDGKKKLRTPARISKMTGIIDVAKDKFKEYSVPMRMAILLHEFCHYFVNKERENEEEADYNALLIYLGLGYPRIEAEKVFLKVFYKSPSDGNVDRYKKIDSIIKNFEKVGISMKDSYYYPNER